MTTHDNVKDFYNRVYYAETSTTHAPSRHMRSLARRVGLGNGMRLLDIACGRGEWLRCAADQGCEIAGIDISDAAVAQCLERHPGADIRQGVAEQLPWPDSTFDFISCLGSLEHFLDPDAALSEMRRVATPDARLLILVPNTDFLLSHLGLYRGTIQSQIAEQPRTLSQWRELFGANGIYVDERWRDLHVISTHWITSRGLLQSLPRALVALSLSVLPLRLQYQVYHLCHR